MGHKSRHYRNESDPLLGFYSQTLEASTSVRNAQALYGSNRNINNSIRPASRGDSSSSSLPHDNEAPVSPLRAAAARFTHSTRCFLNETSSPFRGPSNPRTSTKSAPDESKETYRVHRVSYTAHNHVQVLFQMYGSAFPQVLPFCLLNIVWTLVVFAGKHKGYVDLTFHSSVGHSFMGLLVSFLVVSRSKISYDRFMDFRRRLATCYRACREIGQFTTVYTYQYRHASAKQWRSDVCFRTILLLRVAMDALLWSSTERERWEEEFYCSPATATTTCHGVASDDTSSTTSGYHEEEKEANDVEAVTPLAPPCPASPPPPSEHFLTFRSLTHGRRSMIDENFRAPITFAHILRQRVMEHPAALGVTMPVNEYRDLLEFVTIFIDAFHEFRVLVFTPYPFPLVQMTRAFLFVWVYTLPMVLLKEYRILSSLLIVSLVSFGFVGIEYVSMALDDPFGDDTNDVDEHGMALLVYEDIYLSLYRTDGPAAAVALRQRVLDRYRQGRGLDCYRRDILSDELWMPQHLQRELQTVSTPESSTKRRRNKGEGKAA